MTAELWDPQTFDGLRRQLIPSFDLLYGSAASAVAMTVSGDVRVLDLGAGTGLLTVALLAEVPDAEVVIFDGSENMLSKAITRFSGNGRVRAVVGDLGGPIPHGPFDAIVSGLAIHHLEHEDKRHLFSRLYQVLRPGGIFVNVEQVLAPVAEIEPLYDQQHERHVIESATPAEEWAAGRERMKHDRCTDVDTQLGWLKEAGFRMVDCLAKDWRFATYAAWKAR